MSSYLSKLRKGTVKTQEKRTPGRVDSKCKDLRLEQV